MKKNISVVIIALLVLTLSLVLVSCDDTEKSGLYTNDGEFIAWEDLISKGYISVSDNILEKSWSDLPGGKLVIDNSITQIGDEAFYGKQQLTGLFIPNTVTAIGSRAFYLCNNLTTVEFEENSTLQDIGSYAFYACLLDDIFIPKSVVNIFYKAYNYSKNTIVVEEGNAYYDSRNNCNAIILTESDKLILGCDNTTIPTDIQIIGEEAFYGSNIANVDFKQLTKLHTLEEDAFTGCPNLKVVELPSSIKRISSGCFTFCDNLETVIFPEDYVFSSSEDMALNLSFHASYKLKNIVLPKEISQQVFRVVKTFLDSNNDPYHQTGILNLFAVSDEDISQYFNLQTIGSISEKIRTYNKNQWTYQNGIPVPTA